MLLTLPGIYVQHLGHLYLCLDGTFWPAGSKLFLYLLLMNFEKHQEFHSSPFSFVCKMKTHGSIVEKVLFPLSNTLYNINKICSIPSYTRFDKNREMCETKYQHDSRWKEALPTIAQSNLPRTTDWHTVNTIKF